MEDNLLKNDITIGNNQNDIVNTNTTPKKFSPEVIGITQSLNVQFFVQISKHAKDRYEERQLEGLSSWSELLMHSDFGVQVFNAILTKRVKLMKGTIGNSADITERGVNSDNRYDDNSFIYYNAQHNISLPLFWTNYMISEDGTIKISIFIKTVYWKSGSIYRYKQTEKGQQVLSSDKATLGYDASNVSSKTVEFKTLIPIQFKVKNAMAPRFNDIADQCISQLGWKDRPTRVAAGCIRKCLSRFITMWIFDKVKVEDMFTLIEDRDKNRPPLYVGIMFNGFNPKSPMFFFAFRKMSFNEFSYGEDRNMSVTNVNDDLVRNILSNGSKVQDGLRRYAYISETRLKQIIKESLLKYLGYIL